MKNVEVFININSKNYKARIEPRMLLVHFIREVAGLTGTHIGCDTTDCGACTVLMDGKAVKSCTVLAVQARGRKVKTIEGVGEGDKLARIQRDFVDERGLQCGFCTPGMIMSAIDLVTHHEHASEAEIRAGLQGNLCRCTGYHNIVRAVMQAAPIMRGTQS